MPSPAALNKPAGTSPAAPAARRFFWLAVCLAGWVLAGCATPKTADRPAYKIIGPDPTPVGRVVSVNTNGNFAVVNFPLTRLPDADQPLTVFRHGVKVGELKTSRWRLDDNVAADIVSGQCQVGDEVTAR